MKQVRADGMSPTHVPPLITQGIELIEEMILTVKVDETIRIVGPILARREVHLRAIGLLIVGGGSSG
jgi:hypothetical protein